MSGYHPSSETLPNVSIIVPCYNPEEFIEETFEFALSHEYGNMNITGLRRLKLRLIVKYVGF
jgi:glycosyltransferase involved in cell wall biosynthesis